MTGLLGLLERMSHPPRERVGRQEPQGPAFAVFLVRRRLG